MTQKWADCPHCGKPIILQAPPKETKDPEDIDHMKTTIDDDLRADAELLDVAIGDGVIIYALKEWQSDKTVWRRINEIIKSHGGKWIAMGPESHWEGPT